MTALAVASAEEAADAVRGAPRVLPVGGGTKPALSVVPDDEPGTLALDVSGLSGVVEHDPAELTITVRAGTPLAEIRDALGAHGQHLPFDPPLVDAGGTIGGALAAGVSGPGAYGHGGVRDFVLGVRFVDGTGTLVRGGGRVVKNAAGFDLPKLLVGSAGRLGVLVELTFKVFPRPPATATLAVDLGGLASALAALDRVAGAGMELVALDVEPPGRLLVGIADAPERLAPRLDRLAAAVGEAGERLNGEAEAAVWRAARELTWASPDALVARVALDVRRVAALVDALPGAATVRISLGGAAAWVAWPAQRPVDELDAALGALDLSAVVLRGPPGRHLLGRSRAAAAGPFAERIRRALDPAGRFLDA